MHTTIDVSALHIKYAQAFSCEVKEDLYTQKKTLPFLSIVSPEYGYYEISTNGCPPVIVNEGECFIVAAGVFHTIIHHIPKGCPAMHPKWIFLQICYLNYTDLTVHLNPPLVVRGSTAKDFINYIDTMLALEQEEKTIQIACKRLEIAIKVFGQLLGISPPLQDQYIHSIFSPAMKMIDDHLKQKLCLDMLAEACHLSKSTFCALFKNTFGISPFAYVLRKRLAVAASMLINADLKLSDIAQQTGFYDEYHLSRVFKQIYDVSPTEYKKIFYHY